MELGISLGSNIGDKVSHLRKAREGILSLFDAQEVAASALYETEPVDVLPENQDLKFYNAVLIIESEIPAEKWLPELTKLETALGRKRNPADKNAPRTIDADIIYAGERCIDSGGLVVPHPRWAQRRFVVEPLAEIRGELTFPGYDQNVNEILAELADSPITKLDLDWSPHE